MTTPTVVEVPLRLEAVTADPFIAVPACTPHRSPRARAPKGNRRPR